MELILVHLIYSYLIRLESYQNNVLTNKSHLPNILFILVDGIKMSQTESTDKNQYPNLIRLDAKGQLILVSPFWCLQIHQKTNEIFVTRFLPNPIKRGEIKKKIV